MVSLLFMPIPFLKKVFKMEKVFLLEKVRNWSSS